jgi:8-oxo-dGTP pyrophosphatase MutT (NUDIX family)
MENRIAKLRTRLAQPLPYARPNDTSVVETLQTESQRKIRICAVLIVLFEHDQQIYIPFMARPDDGHVHSGQVSFPGGGREKEDNDLIDTALRETWEEIGVQIGRDQIIGALSDIYIPVSYSLVTPYVAFIPEKPTYRHDPKEVAQMIEVSLSELQNTDNQQEHTVTLPNKIRVKMPAYNVQGHFIWGATARILHELLICWKEAGI